VTASDRALIERAITDVLAAAPAGWTRLVAEFDPYATPAVARASVVCDQQLVALPVPAEAVGLVAEYQRRTATPGQRMLVALDSTGNVELHTGRAEPAAVSPATTDIRSATPSFAEAGTALAGEAGATDLRKPWVPLWLWVIVALMAPQVLLTALDAAHSRLTVRAMAASESMPDDQARQIAANTARVWIRERQAQHLDNVRALTCPGVSPHSIVAGNRVSAGSMIDTTGFIARQGSTWKLDAHQARGTDVVFVFQIYDGELRLCGTEAPRGLF
jgi:hypothetical protein